MHSGSRCLPRFATPRNPDRPTLGPHLERAALAIHRKPAMPWQRDAAAVTQEIDPDTGLRWYGTVVVIVPRQSGKTWIVEGELTKEAQRRREVTSVYGAQTRQMAAYRLLEEWEARRLRRSPATRGRYKAVRSKGSEAIYWHNDSKTVVIANTDEAGHGLTINGDAVVDEAFAHTDLTVVGALSPPMVTCPDPQLWIVSTLGDGTDGLLQHYQDIGSAALHDPDSRVCYIEYSAAPGLAIADPATWWSTIPSLGHTVTEQQVRQQLVNLGEAEFDRAFLCRRNEAAALSKIPADSWARQARDAGEARPHAPYVLAAAVAHDRSHASIAVAARTGLEHELVVIVDRRPGTSWLLAELLRLQAAHRPAAIYIDRRSPAGSMIDKLTAKGVHITEPDTVQFMASTGVFYDGIVDDVDVVHLGQPDLDVAVAQARTRPLGDSWAWNMRESPIDISPLCAGTLAVWGHRHQFPVAHRSQIHA